MKGRKIKQRRTERYPNTCEPLLSIKETAREAEIAVSEYKTRTKENEGPCVGRMCKGRLRP